MSPPDKSQSEWTTVHKLLHWIVAAAVILQLALGFQLDDLAAGDPQRIEVLRQHATLGITVLVLMLIRLAWRVTHPVPSPPATLSPRAAAAAIAVHRVFYIALLVLPLSGLALVAASGDRVPVLGGNLPGFGAAPDSVRGVFWFVHIAFALAVSLLVLGHMGAAIVHAVKRDGTFSRMLPWR